MLEEAHLKLQVVAGLHTLSPESAQEVEAVDERLVGRQAEGGLRIEEVVGLRVVGVHRVAIFQEQVDKGIELPAEESAVVAQIAGAHREREVYGQTVAVVVVGMLPVHVPCLAPDDAVEASHGVDDGGCGLAQETAEAPVGIVEDEFTDAVGHLAYGHAATSGGHDIIDGGRLHLAAELPHQTAAEGVRSTLPKRKSVGTG